MSKVKFITSAGIGDALQAFSCAHYVQNKGNSVDVDICARTEVFNPLNEIFKDKFNIKQISEAFVQDYQLEKNIELWNKLTLGYDEAYFVLPDTLFRNPHKFDYKKYNLNLSQIKNTKLLLDKWNPEKICYLGLLSTTAGYTYPFISELIAFLCQQNPDWKFYLAQNVNWDGKLIHIDIKNIPKNLIIENNPSFIQSFEWLCKSSLAIVGDNGISHLAYHLGIERVLLDPQWNRFPWIIRWREDYSESLPITTSAIDVAKIIKNLLNNELSRLIPRKLLLDRLLQGDINYSQELIYKF